MRVAPGRFPGLVESDGNGAKSRLGAEYLKAFVVEEVGHETAEALLKATSQNSEKNPTHIDGARVLSASSGAAWVLSSDTGAAPLMASDAHSPVTSYNRWIVNEVRWSQFGSDSSTVHVAGSSLPGVPLVLQGRNEWISWSYATANKDTEDLFIENIETFSEGDGEGKQGQPKLVLSGGERDEVKERLESIHYPGKREQS